MDPMVFPGFLTTIKARIETFENHFDDSAEDEDAGLKNKYQVKRAGLTRQRRAARKAAKAIKAAATETIPEDAGFGSQEMDWQPGPGEVGSDSIRGTSEPEADVRSNIGGATDADPDPEDDDSNQSIEEPVAVVAEEDEEDEVEG